VNVKKISLLIMMLFSHVDIFYTAAGEEKNADRLDQISFRDEVINNFKINFVSLQQGFDLIGLNYDSFLETQREFIPEDGNEDEGADDNYMKKIITNAENIIIERMQTILEQGFQRAIDNQSDIDYQMMRVLDYAIYYKLSSGSKILRYLKNIPNLLINAVIKNNIGVIGLLIALGLNVNTHNHDGITPLMVAAKEGYTKVVSMLITAGADINTQDNQGKTALICATENGHEEAVQLLIAAGVDINIRWQALIIAAEKGYVGVVKALLNAGTDMNFLDNRGWVALSYAVGYNHVDIVQLLIAEGVDLNNQNNNDTTQLMVAAKKGHVEVIKVLLDAGVDVNFQSNNSWTALKYAVKYNHKDVVKVLLDAGADVNLLDERFRIALRLMFC